MNDSDRLEDYDDIKKDKRVFKKFIFLITKDFGGKYV